MEKYLNGLLNLTGHCNFKCEHLGFFFFLKLIDYIFIVSFSFTEKLIRKYQEF